MKPPRLNLVVLRVADIERSAAFYGRLGLAFTRHAHGSGPTHYACEAGGMVFELYPAAGQPVSASTRVGFAVEDVDAAVEALTGEGSEAGATVVVAPKDSPWGRRAVVADLDGYRVELISAPENSDLDQ